MTRLLAILMGIVLLLSMATGAVAHASEQVCAPDVEISASSGHAAGDPSQVPDTEKGVPHHHGGCHGHHLAAPVDHRTTAWLLGPRPGLIPCATTIAASNAPGAALRPPIA